MLAYLSLCEKEIHARHATRWQTYFALIFRESEVLVLVILLALVTFVEHHPSSIMQRYLKVNQHVVCCLGYFGWHFFHFHLATACV